MVIDTKSKKYIQVSKYSNPHEVSKKALQLGFTQPIQLSTRKDKKYMIFHNNTYIHFGQMNPPMEDFTKHKNIRRRDLFRTRNHKWADAPKYSARNLSYHLLW